MCKFCDPILGPGGFAHTEAECPLKQGCYCPVCGPGTHFPIHCPHRPKRASRFAPAITSVTPAPITTKTIVMEDSNSGYVEYLKQHGLEIYRKQSDNRDAVAEHLLSRKVPLTLVTNKVPKAPPKPAAETACGVLHGANDVCVAAPKQKKKITKVEA